jgi:hypothetical protein
MGAPKFGIYCAKEEIDVDNIPILIQSAFHSIYNYPELDEMTAMQAAINRPFMMGAKSHLTIRTASFANWPLTKPSREDMVDAGFIYLGVGDRTRTFCCDRYVQNWSELDDPIAIHLLRSPTCNVVMRARISTQEQRRAQTFVDWPHQQPHRDELIKAGFLYLGEKDRTRTFCCQLTVQDWEPNADPIKVHLTKSPDCKHAMGNLANKLERKDVTFNVNPTDFHERVVPGPPREIRFNSYLSRFLSFRNWPKEVKISFELMAKAGFYYEGKLDFVKCFHCNGGAMKWKDEEDPYRRHARMYPGCEYIIYIKGINFIEQAASAQQILAMQERVKLYPDLRCKICVDAVAAVCYMPCFHLGICISCARRSQTCPFCREASTGVLPANLE